MFRYSQGTAVEFLGQPFAVKSGCQQCRGEATAEMRVSFAPIETFARKRPPLSAKGRHVDTDRGKSGSPRRRYVDRRAAASAHQPFERDEAIIQVDAQPTGEVVIAGPGSAQATRRRRREGVALAAGEYAQVFQQGSDIAACEAVIAVLALGDGDYEVGL